MKYFKTRREAYKASLDSLQTPEGWYKLVLSQNKVDGWGYTFQST